jgi:hypothetical protein
MGCERTQEHSLKFDAATEGATILNSGRGTSFEKPPMCGSYALPNCEGWHSEIVSDWNLAGGKGLASSRR